MKLHDLATTFAATTAGLAAVALITAPTATADTSVNSTAGSSAASSKGGKHQLRVATFNASLNRSAPGQLAADLADGGNEQARTIATLIQAQNPDVIVVNEFDYDPSGASLDNFNDNYLAVPQREGLPSLDYPYRYTAPVNTGVDSGLDLDGNGVLGEANDAYGFGLFPGQYGMAVYSRHPLETGQARTFQNLRWDDMPDNLLPYDYYGQNADKLRLSSKSHWDLPVDVDGRRIHLIVSHPTPPSFDGPEQRNGRRNSDENRLTADYLRGGEAAGWITDDAGRRGGLEDGEEFIVFGDLNSDPFDAGYGYPGVKQILQVPRVQDPAPESEGARQAGVRDGNRHAGPDARDTADFSDPVPGNLRADYVLPSDGLSVAGSHVFWPAPGEAYSELMDPEVSSDHRMVVLDLTV